MSTKRWNRSERSIVVEAVRAGFDLNRVFEQSQSNSSGQSYHGCLLREAARNPSFGQAQSVNDILKVFSERHPSHLLTSAGQAAMRFEANLAKNHEDLWRKVVETQVVENGKKFYVTLFGGLSKKDIESVIGAAGNLADLTLEVRHGDRDSTNRFASDFTVFRGQPNEKELSELDTVILRPVNGRVQLVNKEDYERVKKDGGVEESLMPYVFDMPRSAQRIHEARDTNGVRWLRDDGWFIPDPSTFDPYAGLEELTVSADVSGFSDDTVGDVQYTPSTRTNRPHRKKRKRSAPYQSLDHLVRWDRPPEDEGEGESRPVSQHVEWLDERPEDEDRGRKMMRDKRDEAEDYIESIYQDPYRELEPDAGEEPEIEPEPEPADEPDGAGPEPESGEDPEDSGDFRRVSRKRLMREVKKARALPVDEGEHRVYRNSGGCIGFIAPHHVCYASK